MKNTLRIALSSFNEKVQHRTGMITFMMVFFILVEARLLAAIMGSILCVGFLFLVLDVRKKRISMTAWRKN